MAADALDSYLSEAQRLLYIWGAWQRSISAGYRLSYPKSVPFIHASEVRADAVDVDDPVAEHIDRILGILNRISEKKFQAILCWYVYEMYTWQAAQYCKCSEKAFKTYRECAEYFVAGALSAMQLKNRT